MRRAPLWMGFVRLRKDRGPLPLLALLGFCFFVRFTKGAVFSDALSLLSKPFWPGPAQSEWIKSSTRLENQAKLSLLEKDNQRLRKMLALQNSTNKMLISAAVIARKETGWWQQIELNKGSMHGINPGNPVMGPGGLLGIIRSSTKTTSRVRLLTAPGSRVGVWLPRAKKHGILIGLGTNRPSIIFLDKDPKVLPGDLLSTSPASTLLPPNIPIGVIQIVNKDALPSPTGTVQLISAPEAIDWVQIKVK